MSWGLPDILRLHDVPVLVPSTQNMTDWPGGSDVKRLLTVQETRVQSLGREDLLEKEMATHSSILAWKIPRTEKPGRLQSMGSQRVRHDWVTSLHFTSPRTDHIPHANGLHLTTSFSSFNLSSEIIFPGNLRPPYPPSALTCIFLPLLPHAYFIEFVSVPLLANLGAFVQYHCPCLMPFGINFLAQLAKNPPAMQETPVQFLGWEDPPEKGMATHSSTLT